MEIHELKAFDAPNMFSVKEPIVRIQVKLGELADIPTRDIGNLNDNIIRLFPGIRDHKCSNGYIGGFVDRLKEGTYLAHVTEHLCLETQRLLGYDIKHGKARQINDDVYNIIYACFHPVIGKACGIFVIKTLNALIAGNMVDMGSELEKLKKISVKYDMGVSTCAIIEEAKKRGIPVSVVNDGELVRLGYGKYQKCISATLYEGNSSLSVDAACSKQLTKTILDEISISTSIPIISITGTNGKTTTTRMISSVLRRQGLTVGTTTTHGIYINDKCIESGDTTGPKSAKRILNNREVEAAVLETARGGIIREGLAYEKADIAVFTNLTEDHLGLDGINTMEELFHVKSLVVEAVKDDGACVLNADDPWVTRLMEKAKGKLVLFTMDYTNPILMEHISNGGIAIYKMDNYIFITSGGIVRRFISLREIPATLEGRLKHNIYNSMAAIGACFALGISFDVIKQAISIFTCDMNMNPGRFNIHDLGEFRVVLDYGHNIDGYRATIEGLKSLAPSRLIGIIGVPGDRLDTHIFNVGKISGKSFDYLFVKEDKDLRGRQPLEVPKLLYDGALEGGISHLNIEIMQDEAEALKKSLKLAQNGDVIAVFFEKIDPLIELINNFIKADAYLNLFREPVLV
jgi:UDP-N-acetylmuramyl tripeptide synthase